jgi:hypothetical protein
MTNNFNKNQTQLQQKNVFAANIKTWLNKIFATDLFTREIINYFNKNDKCLQQRKICVCSILNILRKTQVVANTHKTIATYCV